MANHLTSIQLPCPICNHPGHYAYTGTDLLFKLPGNFVYAECEHCGAIYQDPMPPPETIASFYPDNYAPYKQGKRKGKNVLEKSVLRALYGYQHLDSYVPNWLGKCAGMVWYRDSIPFAQAGSLLDIGCGGGNFLLSMQNLGWKVEGVEFNESAVKTCRKSGLTVFHGELAAASFPDDTFDVVTARHVIEHIPDPCSFVSEIFRIVKPGGFIILKTPNSLALARNWFGNNWFANEVPRHLILYSAKTLQFILQKYGFKQNIIRTFSTPKNFLNSWDYLRNTKGKPSKKRKLRRFFAKIYVGLAFLSRRGDEIFTIFQKPVNR
jgi:2-polyprenyl-3-methyl-5-hydroxy-6-metoxy-1,4-benzoquinol methylase